MSSKLIAKIGFLFILFFYLAAPALAGNKRYMTINAAKVLAERALLETVYGLKVRASESVENLVASSYIGTTETKTIGLLKGVMYDEIVYDTEKDVAKVTASVKLAKITNINGETIDLKGKTFRRTAFATSTPSETGPLKVLRAAEIDAYKQLAKQLVGFSLESQTKVENYMLSSDLIKSKIQATLILAELTEYGWYPNGDAFVRMSLNLREFKDIIGQGVSGGATVVKVEGIGAQVDDFSAAKQRQTAIAPSVTPQESAKVAVPAPAKKVPVQAPAKISPAAATVEESTDNNVKGLMLFVSSDKQLNSYQEKAHTLLLCVYQLKGPNGFNQLKEEKIGTQKLMECTPFDSSAATAKRLVIQPGNTLQIELDRAEGARYLGISAGYFGSGSEKQHKISSLPTVKSDKGVVISIDLGSIGIQKIKVK